MVAWLPLVGAGILGYIGLSWISSLIFGQPSQPSTTDQLQQNLLDYNRTVNIFAISLIATVIILVFIIILLRIKR